MSDAPKRIWLDWPAANNGDPVYDEPPERDTQPGQTAYVLATPAALSEHPAVQALVAEAVAAERERCVAIAVRHWEGEPEDTIAMTAEMRVGMKPMTDYERKVAQMKEDFPNGV